MQDNILHLTKQLMRIASSPENPNGVHDALELIKTELGDGFTVDEYENNGIRSLLIHTQAAKTKNFKIILNAHVDVVSGTPEQFMPVEKDGKLHGRGAYDMKGAVAVMTLLFKKFAQQVSYPLALQVVTDEETGGINGTCYQIKEGLQADFAITGDCGPNLAIVNQAKGIMWLKLHTSGSNAHGAYLWRGDNALWDLHYDLAALNKLFPVPEKEAWATTMNLAKIETNNKVFNYVPADATAYLDFRFIPEDEKTIVDKIKQAISPDTTIEILFKDSPEYTPKDNHYIKLLQNSYKAIIGADASFRATHAPSDMRHYSAVEMAGVEFGPIGKGQHEDEEWVDIASLEDYYKILEHFLLSIQH